ncbi:MAG TPA: hypothetical protein DCP69_02835 [Candidatus Omnitrophica bacterium]|nr:hypothetical protein [Candidatus Omnitrophota bacterium]
MTDVLAIGRQRATLLNQLTARLVELETDVRILYPAGHERHERAQADYDALEKQVAALEVDTNIAAFKQAEAARLLSEKRNALDTALANCATELANADEALTKAQDAVDALQARQTRLIADRQALG